MHLMKKIAAIVLTLGLSASMTGCGFHLRGDRVSALPTQYKNINLDIPQEAKALASPLTIYLSNLGAKVDVAPNAATLRIAEYSLRRQLFSGKLTEVQLRVSASFVMLDEKGQVITAPRTVISQRSYQYDTATVNTERQEENYLIKIMQDDIAQQIVRQLHANRLPELKIDQAP